MTTMELKAKLEKMENVQTLMDEIRNAPDENAVMEILHKFGLDVTKDELVGIRFEGNEELSVDQLDHVAGGKDCKYNSLLHKILYKLGQLIGIHDKNSCPVDLGW